MSLFHVYTQTVADGTATSVVRPSDWNSGHVFQQTISGNTSGQSTFSGTNLVLQGGNNVTLSASTAGGAATLVISAPSAIPDGNSTLFQQTSNTSAITSNALNTSQSSLFQQTSNTSAITSDALNTSQSSLFQQTSNTSAITTNAFPSADTTKFAGTGFTSASTTGTDVVATLGTNGLSVGIPPYLTAAGFTNTVTASNGSFTTDQLYFSNWVNMTFQTRQGTDGKKAIVANGNYASLDTAGHVSPINLPAMYIYASGNTTVDTLADQIPFQSLIIYGQGAASVGAVVNKVTVSVPVQTNQAGSVYATGNTTGTSSGTYDARTLSMSGAGAVSIAASNSGFVISAPTQTNQAGNVYAAGNTTGTSSGTYDARTLSIRGSGIVSVAASNSGFVISASQSAQAGTLYVGAQSTGTSSGTYDARTLSINGAGIVSVAASNSGFVVSASQSAQAGNIYAVGNTTGTSSGTYDARTLSISGAGAVTVAASNSGYIINAPVQTVQSAVEGIGISASGNTAGTTGIRTGQDVVFVGTNNITLSRATAANIDTIVISGPTQSNQAGSLYVGSQSTGTSSGTYDARTLSFNGAGIVSVAASNSGVVISAVQSAQAGTLYVGAQSTGTSSGTYDARTLSINGAGIVSVAASNSGFIVSATVPAQTNQAGNLYAVGNTTGTSSGTYDARTLSINGAGIVSVAASNSGYVVSATVPAQTNQSVGAYAVGNTSGTSSGTADARSLSIRGSGAVSVAASNSGWVINAPAQSNQGNSYYATSNTIATNSTAMGTYSNLTFAGAGVASVGVSNGSVVISVPSGGGAGDGVNIISVGGNTSGTLATQSTGTILLAGGNNITLSQNGTNITISGPSGGGIGVSNLGNTAGTTGLISDRLVLVGSNGITLSQSTNGLSGTVTIQGATNDIEQINLLGNTSGTTSMQPGNTMYLSALGDITLSGNNNTIVISAAASETRQSFYENLPREAVYSVTGITGLSQRPFFQNVVIPEPLVQNMVMLELSRTTTGSNQFTVTAGIYTFVNNTSAALVESVVNSYSQTATASISGARLLAITGWTSATNLPEGMYLLGFRIDGANTASYNYTVMGATAGVYPNGILYPGANSVETATTALSSFPLLGPLNGKLTATSSNLPSNIAASQLSMWSYHIRPRIIMMST